ncbi:MAG: SpoIVB peptidase S55 domain-containing protein, partial [Veillonella parvula]|nr:SpoIVB peptidase S55 domain-containing protein [Veillonella parvula]
MKFSHSWRRYRKAILALFFCTSLTTAQAIDFMPVNDVTTGMEGIAKTVIVGDTISTFDVKVLGVMKDKGPSGHLILAKFSGPVMDQTGGIAHGMSGSPVYINGKLVGAVAYGWGFADGTIGMITPIEDMVKLWNIPYEKNLSKPWDDTQLKLGAIGTVTHVDGEKVVAFGHPFLKHGSSNYFMHNASIFTVVKSYNAAFKLGSMGKEIGSVTEDRGAGIAGVSGVISPGIPLRFHLKDLDMGRDRTSSVKVIEDGEMTPTLAATALYNMLNKTLDRSGSGTATISYTITPKGKEHKPLTRTNMFYSSDSISEKAVDEFYNVIDVLMNNRFINYEISDISVETNVTQDKKTAKLIDASASSTVVSPGDTIVVDVTLEPFRGEKVIKQIFFKVPEDQAIGKYTLEVRGGGEIPLPYVLEKQKYNLTDEILRRLKVHKDFDELYDEIQKTDTNNQIVVEFLEDGISLVDEDGSQSVKKAKLKDVESKPMPGDVKKKTGQEDLSSSKDDEKKPEKTAVDTEYIVQGDGQFTIHVMKPADRDKELAKRVKEAKHQIKMERKLELEDQSKKDKTDKAESKKDS